MRSSSPAGGVATPSALLRAASNGSPEHFPAALPEDQDSGDVAPGIDEDALNEDDLDTDQITTPP